MPRDAPSGPKAGTLVAAMLCGWVCACGGGGGGGGGSPPPPPAAPALLVVTNGSVGTIDVLTIDTATGSPSPASGSPFADGPAPQATAVDPQKRYLYVASS